jgi:hypothetical protein
MTDTLKTASVSGSSLLLSLWDALPDVLRVLILIGNLIFVIRQIQKTYQK